MNGWAIALNRLNWMIKPQPGNTVENTRDGALGAYLEVRAIDRLTGSLLPDIRLIESDTDVDMLSVFALAGYCLTTRGIVGIEAACCGIRTLHDGVL